MSFLDSAKTGTSLARVAKSFAAFLHDEAKPAEAIHGLIGETRLCLVTTPHGLAALEHGWRELESQGDRKAGVFQSYAWISNWCRVYVETGRSAELCIVAGFRGTRLVFALPLMRKRRFGVGILTWLTDPFGQYGDILLAEGECAQVWISQSLRLLRRLKGSHLIRLRHVRADALAASSLRSDFQDARSNDAAPVLDLTAYADEAAYDARYTSAQRKRRKKIRKSLEEIGPLRFEELPPGAASDAAIEAALAEKNKWLGMRGRHNRVLKCPSHAAFLKSLSRHAGFRFALTELSAGGRPISWEIGFEYGGTHFGYITSHKVELTDLSPGRLHMDLSQRQALKSGMQRFDLMVPNDEHKESWSSSKVATADYFLALSARGRLFGIAYLRAARPLARKAYYAAPDWLLRLVSRPMTRPVASS
jgi:CelD/BcsL family acetyltransferase involved in cellulose biosynthesis